MKMTPVTSDHEVINDLFLGLSLLFYTLGVVIFVFVKWSVKYFFSRTV